LEGIRILDLADEKVSFCSKLLADMGACVIKVEKPGGDSSREIGPFQGGSPRPEKSLFFQYNNTNKLGITLNLEHPAGREIFREILKRTDVVIETFSPGYLKSIGLGFEVLKEINPKTILVSVTAFGQDGPRRQFKSCDLVASASGGQMYVSGSPLTPPLKPFGEQSYYIASLYGAIAVLLALRERTRTGKGRHIDISLQEAVVSTLEHVMVRYFYDRVIPKRQGGLHWNSSFCILPCKDGHILITLFQQWDTLIEWMDSEGMAGDLRDESYGEEAYRLSRVDHILEVLERWTKSHTTRELFELGQVMSFPWAPISSPAEVLDNPQLKARQFFIDVDDPESGKWFPYPGLPYRFGHSSPRAWKRAPLPGQDNIQIYHGELGLPEEEVERLSSAGVI
jgi:crotonobetainyl-CoA:carnitine CoA-transferase CaiB-like acyl-CoA transferase